ncbi:MAG: hypothetical protein ABEH65_03795 [Halobacteriales archaeon]
MPEFDIETEPINVFKIDDQYLFTHYFDRTDLFDQLRPYYNDEEYRFEVPADDFETVRTHLTEEYFDPRVIEDPEPYCVVKEMYTEHAAILRDSVAHWERAGHLFFLMKDELAVKEALEQGATHISETDFVPGI